MGSRKKFSHYVSDLMDGLGYSFEMIKCRQQMRYSLNVILNRHGYKIVTTGGKGEGTSLYFESDIDIMVAMQNVICTDNPVRFINEEHLTSFCTERSGTSPGYTRLKLLKLENNNVANEIIQSLFEAEDGTYYLSSRFFTDACTLKHRQLGTLKVKETSGPSAPVSDPYSDLDIVCGFICLCPDLLENWVSRRMAKIIHEVSLLDGHVVPVGFKGSEEMYREWRICFSFAELHLMRNFNETQLKVYILLKKICKSVLKPVCEDMTSYIMKNVVFWVCEEKGIQQFTTDLLMDRLFDCIIYLRTCVIKKCLPSYMIPERNLFAGRLDIQQRQQLIRLLGNLLHEEGRMLLRCDQLRDAMIVLYITPDMFREFSEKRDKVESLFLIYQSKRIQKQRPGMSFIEMSRILQQDEEIVDILNQINYLILPDVRALLLAGRTSVEIDKSTKTRIMQILS